MRKSIQLSDLVISEEFLEGSALFHNRSIILLSVSENNDLLVVKGALKNKTDQEISFTVDKSGKLISKSCSNVCSGICSHVVALALLFNEMSVENADPSEQLSRLETKNTFSRTEFPCKVIIEKKDLIIVHSSNDFQMKRISEFLGKKNMAALIALFPDKFILGNVRLSQSDLPLTLFYEIEKGHVRFFFSEHVHYFQPDGVVVDSETGKVWRFSSGVNATVETLVRISISYNNKDDLIKAVADLSDNLFPDIKLSGELNLEKIEMNESTEVIYDTYFENGKIYLSILLGSGNEKIEFRPKRKNYDQNYPVDGRVYSLSPKLIKNIKNALSNEGFRLTKELYQAPVSKFSEIIKEDSFLNKTGKVVTRKEIKKINIPENAADKSEIVLDINSEEKWFSFNIRLPETASFITSSELISAVVQYEKGVMEPVVTDLSGVPVILEKSTEFLKKISQMIDSDILRTKERIPVAHILKLLKTKNSKILNSFVGDFESKGKYIEIIKSLAKGELPLLEKVDFSDIPMRKYQIEGFNWLGLLKTLGLGGVLADEMGLGKTLQSLAMIKAEKEDLPSMVVCPKTLIWSWDREINKFFPEMKRIVIDSLKPEERAAKWKNAGKELIITSYAVVINDFNQFKDKVFETVIIDEAQHIKNNNTKRFKILSSIKSRHRFALTGTPLENHISDLWSIFQFVMPGYLGSRKDVDRIEKSNDRDKLEKLSTLTAPFILRRIKKEILEELPELIVKEYPVEMTAKQKEIYLSVLLRGRAEFIEKGDTLNKIEILSILSKLRLAANHPSLVSQSDAEPELSGKVATILELVDEITLGEGRVLIFSQYVKMLSIISKALDSEGIEYFYMDGQTKNRIELVEKFNSGKTPVFLLSLKVGGVGLNLTGADNVIIVDPWWNPATEEQAWSRAHRIGQEKKVVVNKLFSKGTIEEKILDLHQKKKGMTDFFLSKSLKDPSEDFIRMIANTELSINEK